MVAHLLFNDLHFLSTLKAVCTRSLHAITSTLVIQSCIYQMCSDLTLYFEVIQAFQAVSQKIKLSCLERDSNLQSPAYWAGALTTKPPRQHSPHTYTSPIVYSSR